MIIMPRVVEMSLAVISFWPESARVQISCYPPTQTTWRDPVVATTADHLVIMIIIGGTPAETLEVIVINTMMCKGSTLASLPKPSHDSITSIAVQLNSTCSCDYFHPILFIGQFEQVHFLSQDTHLEQSFQPCNCQQQTAIYCGINPPIILNSKIIKNTIPTFIVHKEPPVVNYVYSHTIGPLINFRKKTCDMIYSCEESAFIDL